MLASITKPDNAELVTELKTIPGVSVRGKKLYFTEDLCFVIARKCGMNPAALRQLYQPYSLNVHLTLPECLFAHQIEGVKALVSGEKVGLWHATGVGKTSTGLVASNHINVTSTPTIIVTRSLGRDVFMRDARWAAPGKYVAIIIGEGGSSKYSAAAIRHANKRLEDLRLKGCIGGAFGSVTDALLIQPGFIVIPWETLASHVDTLLATFGTLPLLIIDESHMGKSATADRTIAALRLASYSNRAISMTATPVRDRVFDIWSQWRAVAPEAAGTSRWKFALRYSHAVESRYGGLDVSGPHNAADCARCAETNAELTERMSHWFHIVTRQAIIHTLPPKRRNVIRIPYRTKSSVRHESDVELTMLGIERLLAAAADIKQDHVVERAAEALIANEKIIVVGNRLSWAGQMILDIQEAVATHRRTRENLWIELATGDVSISSRQRLARSFLSQPAPACLVATIDAVSEAIDLQDADRMIVAALPFTPGQLIQLEGRVFRPGMKRPVLIEYLVAESTFDELVEATLLSKLAAVEGTGTVTETDSINALSTGWQRSEEEIISELSAWLNKREGAQRG